MRPLLATKLIFMAVVGPSLMGLIGCASNRDEMLPPAMIADNPEVFNLLDQAKNERGMAHPFAAISLLKKADAIPNKSPHQNQLVLQTLYVYADAARDYRSANEAIDKMLLEKDDGTDTFDAHRVALLKLCQITALKDNSFERVKECAAYIDRLPTRNWHPPVNAEPLSRFAADRLRTLSMATVSVPNKPPIEAPMKIGALEENRMRCRGSLSFITNTDTNIRACTALIESGQETEKELARDFRDRGVHYDYKHDYNREIESYDEAIKLNPNYAEVFRLRGDAYHAKGDDDRAIESYSAALSVRPTWEAFRVRGVLYAAKGEYNLAIQDFDQALKGSSSDQQSLSSRARAYNAKGDYERAIQDFDRALAPFPRDWCNLYGRGLAYRDKGDKNRAAEDFKKAATFFDYAVKEDAARSRYALLQSPPPLPMRPPPERCGV